MKTFWLPLAVSAAALAAYGADIKVPFEKYTLKNGMRVILSQDNSVPVVAVYMLYNVGARSEEKGRTGFAPFQREDSAVEPQVPLGIVRLRAVTFKAMLHQQRTYSGFEEIELFWRERFGEAIFWECAGTVAEQTPGNDQLSQRSGHHKPQGSTNRSTSEARRR